MKHSLPFNVMRHADWDRAPREPVTLAITTFLTPYLGATVASIVAYVAVSAATSMVLSALAPKPKFGGAAGSAGLLVNGRGAIEPQNFVYGTVRKGGTITFIQSTGEGNKILHQVITMAGHEIDAFEAFYLNDKVVTLDASGNVTSTPWNSKIRIHAHRGNQTSSTDDFSNVSGKNLQNTLHSETSCGSSFIGEGIAYLYVRMEYDENVFANGIPLITARIRGKKVYDPRTSTTAYSANSALVIRDYITAAYGINTTDVDDTMFSAAANICDETVALAAGGTQARYEAHGVVASTTRGFDALMDMATSCGGTLFYGAGEYKLKPSDYTAPVKTLTLENIVGQMQIDPKMSSRDNFNTVRGTFVDAEQDYISADYPEYQSLVFKSEDGGTENAIDLTLPFTTSGAAAQRLSKLTLYRGREQITVSADFDLTAFDLEVGDIVALPLVDYGWHNISGMPDGKEFEVQNWRLFVDPSTSAVKVSLMLREISEASLDWNAEELEIIKNNTTLLPYYDAPPVGVTPTAVAKVLSEKLVNQLNVLVTSASSERVSSVEVQYKLSADTTYTAMGSGPLGTYVVVDLDRGDYDIRARSINSFGYKGEWEYVTNFTVDALLAPPADVTNFGHEVSGGTIFLSWSPVPDLDLSYYEIRYSSLSSGVTWGNSQFAVRKVARPATSITVPARAGTWSIKAFDKGGNESVNMTSTYVDAADLPPLGTYDTVTEDATFAGTKTNVSIDTVPNPDELIITDRTSTTSNTGTYEFANQIDVGSSRVARVTGYVTADRYYPDAGLWSKIHGTWTSWPDDFTTWTDEQANFGDYDVQIYAATSPDNSTWSAWALANGQELTGRYFKFKAILTSTNLNVSPAIKTLSAEVAY